ncbi:hypothetical protein [Clostridium butyricum]|uniref:DUF7669 domain-containing protein n=1 Tax=Clostridium butyricum TaxID=1492 RepID=UPI00129A33CE|nr:hypothetical protein [Clostridium butyricum]QGH20219.1 hypothetical protein EBL75_00915 [Clostridium butyricum]QGH24254.1 hypothetical protein EBQ27_00915 [Clostridium butyricum]
MSKEYNCRIEVREAAIAVITEKGENSFTPIEIIDYLRNKGTTYSESTIRTHITSRCCKNAPANHGSRYEDFERTDTGSYKVLGI